MTGLPSPIDREGRATRQRLGVVLVATALVGITRSASAQAPALPVPHPTPAEQADYQTFTSAPEVGPYLGRLAEEVEGVSVDSLSGPVPIPIARIASAGGDRQGAAIARVLIIGAQHGTERAGLEVGLRLARDLTMGRLAGLRRSLDVRIVPMANPWGVEHRRRETAEGIDPDRDHVRLAAAETRALWSEYAVWRPHLVLDLHEIGPSEYPVQIGVPTHPNAPGASTFARFHLLPFAANELARADIRFHEYVAQWPDGRTVEGAASPPVPDGPAGGAPWFTPPPLDPSSARNAFALAGSVAFFIAVSSSRDIIGLQERTDRMYVAVRSLVTAAAGLASELVAASDATRRVPKGPLALRARYVARDSAVAMPWVFINPRGQREQGRLAPWRSEVAVDASLDVPAGWWLGPDQVELADMLRGHGFDVGGDARDPRVSPLAYPRCTAPGDRAGPAAFVPRPAPGCPPEDALWVGAEQAGGRLLFTLVEPWSDGGWFAAGAREIGAGPAPDSLRQAPAAPGCDADATYPIHRVPR